MKEFGKTRIESDLIGSREIADELLYGVQTLRGLENFSISKFHLNEYPLFINGLAITKMAAARANHELGLLTDQQFEAITQACQEILDGKFHDQFPVDMIQGACLFLSLGMALAQTQVSGRGWNKYQYECKRSDCQSCTRNYGLCTWRIYLLFA